MASPTSGRTSNPRGALGRRAMIVGRGGPTWRGKPLRSSLQGRHHTEEQSDNISGLLRVERGGVCRCPPRSFSCVDLFGTPGSQIKACNGARSDPRIDGEAHYRTGMAPSRLRDDDDFPSRSTAAHPPSNGFSQTSRVRSNLDKAERSIFIIQHEISWPLICRLELCRPRRGARRRDC